MVVVHVMQSTDSEQRSRKGLHRTMLKELGHLLVLFELFCQNTTITIFSQKK